MMQPVRNLYCPDEAQEKQTAQADRQMEEDVFLPNPYADPTVHKALAAGCVSPLPPMRRIPGTGLSELLLLLRSEAGMGSAE